MKTRFVLTAVVTAFLGWSVFAGDENQDSGHIGFKPTLTKKGAVDKVQKEAIDAEQAKFKADYEKLGVAYETAAATSTDDGQRIVQHSFQFDSTAEMECVLVRDEKYAAFPVELHFHTDNRLLIDVAFPDGIKEKLAPVNLNPAFLTWQNKKATYSNEGHHPLVFTSEGATPTLTIRQAKDGTFLLEGKGSNPNLKFYCPRGDKNE